MDLSLWTLIYVLVMKINQIYALSPCQASLPTVVSVIRCPKNKAEWENRSKRKDCSKLSQSCVKPEEFLYHCLINEYMNMTIEVCAPSVPILGQKCAEFNTVGAVVQDNFYTKCDDSDPPCPFTYNSTDMYKYQRCYSYIKSTNNTEVLPNCSDYKREQNTCSCDENIWLAISVVFIILCLISCGVGGILLYRHRDLLCSTHDQKPEDVPLIAEGKDTMESLSNTVDEDKGTSETDEEKSWVYSIYFGDKYCGTAYLNPKYPEDIISLGNHEIIGALVKKNGEIIDFGDKARNMFTDNETDCSDYTFLDHDKLNMEYWNDTIPTLGSMKVIEVYQNIIGFLVKKIYKKITGRDLPAKDDTTCCESGSCMLCNMHCVITVPNHWKDDVIPLREAFDRTMVIFSLGMLGINNIERILIA
ncbi:uncharacterized protein LOC134267351 [Saccostrea cucullata]|uniref:uncharacterized protein LOC134267351 n=1 Tax=Saccostrea cuccullata TaxID=36930 RepID=UPI002ED3F50B